MTFYKVKITDLIEYNAALYMCLEMPQRHAVPGF